MIEQKQNLEDRLKKIRVQELRQKQRYESGEPLSKRFVGSVSDSSSLAATKYISRNLTRKMNY